MFTCKTLYVAVLLALLAVIISCKKNNPTDPVQQPLIIEEGPPVTDYDGNVYRSVTIGNQTWMAENLKGTRYSDGAVIENFCYNDDTVYAKQYGRLYRWAAAMKNAASSSSNPSRVQGASPAGWHLPSDAEWQELVNTLGSGTVAGGKLKTTDTLAWLSPNTGATNEGKFGALPAGFYRVDGAYMAMRERAIFMTATGSSAAIMVRTLRNSSAGMVSEQFHPQDAVSVRCVKD
jgi:uncharacterized protein (TIGR02145 family)